ncbi:MAG: hypothetical protein ALMCE001_15700 [Methanocorpusculum sp. MCE]|nr:MAG: hypothetical protein ALMCE001_15700 [Methanocorpusculum sp. MCE]
MRPKPPQKRKNIQIRAQIRDIEAMQKRMEGIFRVECYRSSRVLETMYSPWASRVVPTISQV